jgi:cytoskeletal protein RodZ
MPSAGTHLRQLREDRGISLEEIARSTRVRKQYLEALEADKLEDLPPPAFVRGFVRAYCQALTEPPEETLRLYLEQIGEPAPPTNRGVALPRSEREAPARGREPVLVSLILLVVLGLALFALTFALQRATRHNGPPALSAVLDNRRATARSATSTPGGTPAVAERATAQQSTEGASAPVRGPDPLPSRPPDITDPSTTVNRLVARVREKTWIRVQTEDGRIIEELMNPGDTREWMSNRRFVLTIGNAGGLTLELNGRELPPLGLSGQLVRQLVLPPDLP